MTFAQVEFLAFFAVVFVVYWTLPRRAQNVWLTATSFVFYGWVHPWFVVLLVGATVFNYGAALYMDTRTARRRLVLRLAIVANVLLLGTFKYLDFFIENVAEVLELVGLKTDLHVLGILLPVGISFYTFQNVSYVIDVYMKKVKAERSFLTFLAYAAFFPKLIAGPIERAGDLLPQFHATRTLDAERLRSGVSLAAWGLVKKAVVADTLAPYVNAIYGAEAPSNAMAWAAAAGFMVQIFADFSAYTDIARATARLLGFDLRKNFDHPYAAVSPEEYWRRWHITFSEWLRDYVHLPLYDWKAIRWLRIPFTKDDFRSRLARASFLTMVFSGLWHGAAWHFILWGAWWGLLQVVWVYGRPAKKKQPAVHRWWLRPAGLAMMIVLNLVAHQIFREPWIARLPGRFLNPFAGSREELVVATLMLSITLAGAAFLLVAAFLRDRVLPRIRHTWVFLPIETSLWAAAAWATYTFAWQSEAEFIYFQF